MGDKKAPRPDSEDWKRAVKAAEAAMPGWKALVEVAASDEAKVVHADASLPSTAELRKKYAGDRDAAAGPEDEKAREDDAFVVPMSKGPLVKRVGVDKEGKIIWSQG